MFGIWGQHAKTEELVQVAESIAKISGAKKLSRALSVFAEVPFPLDFTVLLKFCHHKDEQVVWYACKALSWFADTRIRELALEFLKIPEMQREGLYLLKSSLEETDWDLFEDLTADLTDDRCEELAIRICEVVRSNPSPKAQKTLLQLYDAGSCVSCRQRILELLHDLEILPDWVFEEAQFDANDHTRETVQSWITPKTP